jgi:quinol-cytochrome oxidoreductase complex cytochrome b subunit
MADGQPIYRPKHGLTRWLDSRLPLPRLVYDQFVVYPTPRNLNIWYTFGAMLAFFLAVQIVTGIVLAMHYVADGSLAFASVQNIVREVSYGWLIRSLHATGATMFFVAVYLHLFRGLYYGSYKAPREIVWILGVLIYLAMVATAFLGYVLPWGQMSYWAATVITSLFGSLPLVGDSLTQWLWGGYAVGSPTLTRFYALHTLMPFVICALVALHIWALHVVGNNNPAGIDVAGEQDTLPFHPYFTVKDAFFLSLFVIVYAALVFYAPDALVSPDNSSPANPLVTPAEIQPEWYFLPYYAMLRAIPFKLLGVAVLLGAFISPLFAPWLDSSKVRSCRYRPLMRWFFWGFVAACLTLGYIGSQPVAAVLHLGVASLPLVWVGRCATLYFFAYFWLVMPILGRIEVPDPTPETIAQPVLIKEGAA